MAEYLVRFAQVHENFRKAEIEALATIQGLSSQDFHFQEYSENSPFAIVTLPSDVAAANLISRSLLTKAIYSIWGTGETYTALHASVREATSNQWRLYRSKSFKFMLDCYQGKRTMTQQREIINGFRYLGFEGPIQMRGAEEEFAVFEEYDPYVPDPKRLFFGRLVCSGGRDLAMKYDLKKRSYISTTSMDAELALITANMALAGPGKLFFDPFVGTGSFVIAAAHFGAVTLGSDIDGRSFKGFIKGKSLVSNFQQYGLQEKRLDCFISDLTNSPAVRLGCQGGRRWLDGIMCDPPYGVREGLKVLGSKDGKRNEEILIDGIPSHYLDSYIPPKKPYSFEAMLNDILDFAASTLVDGGRLSMWMPTSNDEEIEIDIPRNGHLQLISECIQPFNKWSRRLLTYRRLPDSEIAMNQTRVETETTPKSKQSIGKNADDLNEFRRRYFQSSKKPERGLNGTNQGKDSKQHEEFCSEDLNRETEANTKIDLGIGNMTL